MKIIKTELISTCFIYEAEIDESKLTQEELEDLEDMGEEELQELYDKYQMDEDRELIREKEFNFEETHELQN